MQDPTTDDDDVVPHYHLVRFCTKLCATYSSVLPKACCIITSYVTNASIIFVPMEKMIVVQHT